MKFLLTYATGGREEVIELNSLEELIARVDQEKEDIILGTTMTRQQGIENCSYITPI